MNLLEYAIRLRPQVLSLRTGRRASRRYIANLPKPQAYLRPLVDQSQVQSGKENQVEEFEGVMCLVMDRKEAKNALSVQMVGEMREAIAKLTSTSSARLLLLHTPHQGSFCAGADLRERKSMSPTQVSSFLDSLRSLIAELEGIKIPTIGVVDGYALGGGTEIALGCDLRVGGSGTVMSLPEAKLGIIPGAGGTQRLTRLVGEARAKELIFTGRRIDGQEAERIGLVNICAKAPETAWETALILSRQILTSAPLALQAAKQAIQSASSMDLEQGLDEERRIYDTLLETEDRQEGLRAFAEKRKPRFRGT